MADHLKPILGQVANVSLMLMFALFLGLNWDSLIGAIGTSAFIVAIIFISILLAVAYFMGGSDKSVCSVMGLGTA